MHTLNAHPLLLADHGPHYNQAELNSLYHTVSLICLGIELYFIFDGKDQLVKLGRVSIPVPDSTDKETAGLSEHAVA